MRNPLFGSIDLNRALKSEFHWELTSNKITWIKKDVKLDFGLPDVKFLSFRRLQNIWALAYKGHLQGVTLHRGVAETDFGIIELDHPSRCDNNFYGMPLCISFQENDR